MNPDLQAQTDAVIKALTHLETTLHQDVLFSVFALGILLIVLMFVVAFRR